MMIAIAESLSRFVAYLLCRYLDKHQPLRGGIARENIKPREVHPILAEVMDSDTVDRLRYGKAISAEYIISFAECLRLNPVDSGELFIRWGESYMGQFTYRGPDTPQGPDQPNRMDRLARLLSWDRRTLLSFLARTPSAHYGLSSPKDELRVGLNKLAESQSKKLINLRPGDRKGFQNFLKKGVMIRSRQFNEVIAKCLLHPPKGNAPKECWQAHFQRELTADKLRAHYVEAMLDRHILAIPTASWIAFEPDVHLRLLSWVLACYEPFEYKGASVRPYYLMGNTEVCLDGIGHGAKPIKGRYQPRA